LLRVGYSRFIVVGENIDVTVGKVLVELRGPLAGAARVRGGDKAGGDQVVRVFLPLDDQHRRSAVSQEFWQAIRDLGLGCALDPTSAIPLFLPEPLPRRSVDPKIR
jgi:hypothetical protein